MSKTYFLFGVHLHQPVGNFSHIFNKAVEECYFPFFNILKDFPQVKCNVHISGPLYDWILENKKNLFGLLKELVKKGQIELIGGAYYEPILSIIPDEDKFSQIELMSNFIYNNFKVRPKGIWIAERVWQPYLAKIINLSGLLFTFLDDTHFRYAGLMNKEFFGYYTCEEEGKPIFVFPISKTLRYKIPFSLPQEALSLLESFSQKDTLITLFDDGEKFGLWPHTYDWVYKKGWLEKFFLLLSRSQKIETIKASQAIERFSSQGLVYLPTASYEEMGEWVLEPHAFFIYERLKKYVSQHKESFYFNSFLRGGFFKNFYAKYPRLNYLHKRMIHLSQRVNKYVDKKKNEKVFISLWKAQCNCGWWHGIFGGFYLPHIRSAIYENLIKAEKGLEEKENKKLIREEDLDLDGYKEVIFKNKHLICVFSPRGGTLLELGCKRKEFNLLNTITRREESYHRNIREKIKKDIHKISTIHEIVQSKDKDLDKYLIYDSYEKLALVDHLLDKNITLQDFKYGKKFKTLTDKVYPLIEKEERMVAFQLDEPDFRFSKKILFSEEPQFSIEYTFSSFNFEKYNWGVEFNLFFLSPAHIKVEGKEFSLKDFVLDEKETLEIKDDFRKIMVRFRFNEKVRIFLFPIYSVSSSEAGFEKVFQQICVLFIFKGEKKLIINCQIEEN